MAEGIDSNGRMHDSNGQYTSLEKLFDRERKDHEKDHERELAVAKETAQRLEREVEQTALRIDRAVQTALLAVGETARVHADAHGKEHLAHERIHSVEKTQVDKAEASMNKRLESMNEFRATLSDQAGEFISRELFESALAPLKEFRNKALGFGALISFVSGVVGAVLARMFS